MSGAPPGVLNHRWVPVKAGAGPRSGRVGARLAAWAAGDVNREVGLCSAAAIRLVTAWLSSSDAVRLTWGMCLAICWSSRTSSCVTITPAVRIITTPSVRWTPGPGRRPQPIDHAPAAERQAEQDDRRPDGVGEPDRNRPSGRRADGDHAGEDRPGAGRVDEAEGAADDEPRREAVAARPGTEPREEGERTLEALGERRDEEGRARIRAGRRPRSPAADPIRGRRRRRPSRCRRS